jgi:tetratricopeptide (TPR) repeat protein
MKVFLLAVAALGAGWAVQVSAAEKTAGPGPAAPKVVYLERLRGFELCADNLHDKGLLARELVRQALLVAARDELGVLTRDYWLGEPMPAAGGEAPLDLAVTPGNPNRIEILRGVEAERKVVADVELRLGARDYYPGLISAVERLSRTGLVESLKKAGFEGKALGWKPDLNVPDETQRLLEEMTFSSQFFALRRIHAQRRAEGDSPALLAGLVRGYANLGVLSEIYLHPAHKVFKARALIYAFRLRERNVRPVWARYHQAYAYALAGLHQWAIQELEAAGKESAAAAERPSWAEIIDLYCHYRLARFDDDKIDRRDKQLFYLLDYHAAELSASNDLALATGLRAVEAMPECYRVHDGLCRFGGVATGHQETLAGLMLVGQKIYGRLAAADDLPASVRQLLPKPGGGSGLLSWLLGTKPENPCDEFKVRAQVTEALVAAGRASAPQAAEKPAAGTELPAGGETDAKEFSWSVLGHLLRELTLVQVWRRAHFQRYCWSVPTEEFLAEAAPLVAAHPYRPFIECLTTNVAAREEARERLSRLTPESLEYTAYRMWAELHPSHRQRYGQWMNQAWGQLDDVTRDLDLALGIYKAHLPLARKLVEASPWSPQARVVFIAAEWGKAEDQAAAWEKDRQPAVLKALGERYLGLARWADAERCLEAAIELVPDKASYQALAQIYQRQGNEAKWLKTLEGYLEQPDYGLSHARVRQQIAVHFMSQRQWERALPYATAAAETYSAWGLGCAGLCHEGLQNWVEAEKYFRALAERYEGSTRLGWYFFCRRTGQGELAGARELARGFVAEPHDKTWHEANREIGRFYLLEGELPKALASFQACYAGTRHRSVALSIALTADELRDTAARDAALKQAQSEEAGSQRKASRGLAAASGLAQWMAADLAAGGKGEIDAARADRLCAQGNASDREALYYYLAKYLDLHGRGTEAVRLWKRSVSYRTAEGEVRMEHSVYALAAAELLRKGIKPEDYRDLKPEPEDGGQDGAGAKPKPKKS